MNAIPKPAEAKSEKEDRKRKLEDEVDQLSKQTLKKFKVTQQATDNIIVLEEDEDDIVMEIH